MSGVEIEFSVGNGEIGTQDDDRGTETVTGDSRTQSTTTGGPSRIQGQLYSDSSKKMTKCHW